MATAPQRISALETQMDEHSRAMGDLRGLIMALQQKMEALEQKMERRFMWVIGMQFTTLLTLFASMVTIISMLLRRP